MRSLQAKDTTFTVPRRLLDVARDGNQLIATIGADYSALTVHKNSIRLSSATEHCRWMHCTLSLGIKATMALPSARLPCGLDR